MRVSGLNITSIYKRQAINTVNPYRNNVLFGDSSVEEMHQKLVPELDSLVDKALKERSPKEIKVALYLLEKALKLKEEYYTKLKEAKGDLGSIYVYGPVESAKINIATFYNAAIIILLNDTIDAWNDNVKYGYMIDGRRTDDGCNYDDPIALRVKNIEYLKTKLDKGMESGDKR